MQHYNNFTIIQHRIKCMEHLDANNEVLRTTHYHLKEHRVGEEKYLFTFFNVT
jgi:hypothetical protein